MRTTDTTITIERRLNQITEILEYIEQSTNKQNKPPVELTYAYMPMARVKVIRDAHLYNYTLKLRHCEQHQYRVELINSIFGTVDYIYQDNDKRTNLFETYLDILEVISPDDFDALISLWSGQDLMDRMGRRCKGQRHLLSKMRVW